LKNKIDCGADFVLTQLFSNNADFFRFRDYLRKEGFHRANLPRHYSLQSANQIKRFTAAVRRGAAGAVAGEPGKVPG